METLTFHAHEAQMTGEEGIVASKMELGDGYTTVQYRGIRRFWRVAFERQNHEALAEIMALLDEKVRFLWRQPEPYDVEGLHPVEAIDTFSRWTNGKLNQIRTDFCVELIGVTYAQQAGKKFGQGFRNGVRITDDE